LCRVPVCIRSYGRHSGASMTSLTLPTHSTRLDPVTC
jgi:hypothetical protein